MKQDLTSSKIFNGVILWLQWFNSKYNTGLVVRFIVLTIDKMTVEKSMLCSADYMMARYFTCT